MNDEARNSIDIDRIETFERNDPRNMDLSALSSFVDSKFVPILESRLVEAERCLPYSPLATIMLCGSFLEGLLLGIANKNPEDFNRSPQAPKDKKSGTTKQFRDWSLSELIDVAYGLGILRLDVKNLSQQLRNFRNYIHPYQQAIEGFHPERHTAEICFGVVKAAIHNLKEAVPKKIQISGDLQNHPDAAHLALIALIGAWNEENQHDVEVVAALLGIGYDEWLNKAREILHIPNSPLSLKNGVWRVAGRAELLRQLGSRILDKDLDKFRSLTVSVLNEPDPAFELPAGDRYAASIYGKVLKHSGVLRKGIAEGLAILGSEPGAVINCSHGKAEAICVQAVRELLTNADWVLWGTLNDLLPLLAEAAPGVFLDLVEGALRQTTCPFDELFSQEGKGIIGRNYLTGLLWALEGLAWEEQYLVRVCVVLAELSSHDPGGQWANRPSNSLTTILLPWLPQTLASVDKRKAAVRTVLKEQPDVAWNLLIQLLPDQVQTSFGSHKPSWRKVVPDDWKKGVADDEYWMQASYYAELAVTAAGQDVRRLSTLIDHFDHLTKPAFDQLLQILSSPLISGLPEEERLSLWERLTRFTKKHRRLSDAKWALPDELISQLEAVAEKLAPTDPFNRHKLLFSDRDYDLYDEGDNWAEQQETLEKRRGEAISEIFRQHGIQGLIQFSESVSSPFLVGRALDVVDDLDIERSLLPHFLCSENSQHKTLASGFVWQRYHSKGWGWSDNVDKSDWTPEQVGQFLACLPFTKGTWKRASEWLGGQESEYWIRTGANAYEADGELAFAIEKLIEHGRPHAAINCLNTMLYAKQPIEANQCVRAEGVQITV